MLLRVILLVLVGLFATSQGEPIIGSVVRGVGRAVGGVLGGASQIVGGAVGAVGEILGGGEDEYYDDEPVYERPAQTLNQAASNLRQAAATRQQVPIVVNQNQGTAVRRG